jgi:hypothetical protein
MAAALVNKARTDRRAVGLATGTTAGRAWASPEGVMKVMLRIRDLRTAIVDDREFDSIEAARAWLVARPRYDQVLGVPTEGVPVEVSQELKALCRPLDDEERAAAGRLDEAAEAERARRRAEREREKEEAAREIAAEMARADPARPMKVRWSYDGGFENVSDDRPVPDVAREAVLAWVRERDEWVEGRGQIVGEATVELWPGEVPAGEPRIARGGTFFPVTKPASA